MKIAFIWYDGNNMRPGLVEKPYVPDLTALTADDLGVVTETDQADIQMMMPVSDTIVGMEYKEVDSCFGLVLWPTVETDARSEGWDYVELKVLDS